RTRVEHGLNATRERGPVRDGGWHRLIKGEQPHDLRTHQLKPPANLFAVRPLGQMPPTIDLVKPVTQLHSPHTAGPGSRPRIAHPNPLFSRRIGHSSMNPSN